MCMCGQNPLQVTVKKQITASITARERPRAISDAPHTHGHTALQQQALYSVQALGAAGSWEFAVFQARPLQWQQRNGSNGP